ncbi:hypothetical protein LLG95_13360 [bacterium]|nr:hypothetical protein [bacterium]
MQTTSRIILIEFAATAEMQLLALELATEGHSLGLLLRGQTSPDPLDALQLQLEQTGGISCAINAASIQIALAKMQDLFGRVDEILAFTPDFAAEVSPLLQTLPPKNRPPFRMAMQ